MLFRLKMQDEQGNKVGIHIVGDTTYHPGDTIESAVDLCKLVRNKFELVAPDVNVPRPVIPVVTSTERNGGAMFGFRPSSSIVLNLTEDYPQAQAVGVEVLYNTQTKRFAVRKDKHILVRVSKIVSLENYLDGLVK